MGKEKILVALLLLVLCCFAGFVLVCPLCLVRRGPTVPPKYFSLPGVAESGAVGACVVGCTSDKTTSKSHWIFLFNGNGFLVGKEW